MKAKHFKKKPPSNRGNLPNGGLRIQERQTNLGKKSEPASSISAPLEVSWHPRASFRGPSVSR